MGAPVTPKLISCRVCGVIMVKFSKDVCQKCYTAEEEIFARVRDYLRANPGVTVEEVAKAVQTEPSKIEFFISSGRMERVGLQIAHTCQTCNKVIKVGLICPECSKALKEKVSTLQQELKKKLPDGSGGGRR
ncbi:MAG: flagellar protein [Candidatus Ozemobacter sibiricus]|jgi:DNA-binding transcriptional MerR regulator|uniref:Flagellar protein n=1 Tax=Candidatus Ozemobacter sibiricus TaxID=2268124 RepID=A0A367ZUW2_9BACT|nr:MAG: flagellar protein [Candidatus Ozemobacter sibiricus]